MHKPFRAEDPASDGKPVKLRLPRKSKNASPAPASPRSRPIRATVERSASPEELAEDVKPVAGGKLKSPDEYRPRLTGQRFVFTSAQNNTKLHDAFWKSLLHFCKDRGAQLGISRCTYNKNGWAKNGGVTKGEIEADDTIWYDPRIEPFLLDTQVKVADGLVFCGELDILPTAVTPLNGFDSYTGSNSAIIPHNKMHMKSLATMKHDDAKFLYTTGTITQRNYIERRAGQVASHHHVYGALYVEIDNCGDWYVRQINADENGTFFDIDQQYDPSGIVDYVGRPTVTLGDIHVEKLNYLAWDATEDMLTVVNPKSVVLHDLIDFEARNHHNKKDTLFLADQYYNRANTVENAFEEAATFLSNLLKKFPDTKVHAIRSNHDIAFKKWLVENSGFIDPPNMLFWHKMNYFMLQHISVGDSGFDIYRAAIEIHLGEATDAIDFIQEDDSLVIDGIEYGLHGHRGPNGSRGNPAGYRQLGRRACTGHTHSAGIIDGIWTAGVLADLDMGYNVGPSSWSHSNIITHPNGKRQIITLRGNKWRA